LPRLGAPGHAVADDAAPGLAIDRDFAALGRDDACAVQQLTDHLRARSRLHCTEGNVAAGRRQPSRATAKLVPVRSSTLTKSRVLWLLVATALGCGGVRASAVPLGGTRDVEAAPAGHASASPGGSSAPTAIASAPTDEQGAEAAAEEAPVVASGPSSATDTKPAAATTPAPGAFQPRPYAAGQRWTRLLELDGELKVGPGGAMAMHASSHQEARFEVLGATAGSIDKLQIEYVAYVSKMTVMGNTQETPEDVNGKRFVITFRQGKPEAKTASGGTPTKKELETVNDDAREPLEAAVALKELAQLAAKGGGNFSTPGAVALAGGEDEDTHITAARAALRRITPGKGAELDVSYTLTSTSDGGTTIETKLSGTILVVDAPARYQTFTLAGPLELRSSDANGMDGRGTTKLTLTYKY
jgi:hypothetical protein